MRRREPGRLNGAGPQMTTKPSPKIEFVKGRCRRSLTKGPERSPPCSRPPIWRACGETGFPGTTGFPDGRLRHEVTDRRRSDGFTGRDEVADEVIRRPGENVSSVEMEAAVGQLPGVDEVAAYAVPAGIRGGEDEIMIALVPRPGVSLSAEALRSHFASVLPRYAQPRFICLTSGSPASRRSDGRQ